MTGPESFGQLHDPEFLKYVDQRFGDGPIEPEEQDFDRRAPADADAEKAARYRLAQARRLLRLYREWKTGQN